MLIDRLGPYMSSSGLMPRASAYRGQDNSSDLSAARNEVASVASSSSQISSAAILEVERASRSNEAQNNMQRNSSEDGSFDPEAYLMDPARQAEEVQIKLAAKMISEIDASSNSVSDILTADMKSSVAMSMIEAAYSEF